MFSFLKKRSSKARAAQPTENASCSVYAIGTKAMVLPTRPVQTIWPDEATIARLTVDLSDDVAMGEAVVLALKISAEYDGPRPTDYIEGAKVFRRHMEEFRAQVGVGKRKFESELQSMSVMQSAGPLTIRREHGVRGKFAFEHTRDQDPHSEISADVTPRELTRVLNELLAR